jgi:hypothetical protein
LPQPMFFGGGSACQVRHQTHILLTRDIPWRESS